MKNKFIGLVAAGGITVALLAGCGGPGATPAGQVSGESTTATASATPCGSCDGQPQADHTGPSVLVMDAEATDAATASASAVMAAYTANKPKEEWFASLAPLLTTQYAEDAQYIEPSRLPVRKITSGPVLEPGVSTGYQVRAGFVTNAGDWVVILTRSSASAPWLASNVLPAAEAK